MRAQILPVFLLLTLSLQAQLPSLGGSQKTWAVIAGISDYKSDEITDLQFADRDAQAFYDFLTSPAGGKVPPEQISLFLNEQATNANISTALYFLASKVGEGDRVYIYFSGHGDVEINNMFGFLLPWDSPPRVYITGAIDLSFLQRIITTLSVQNKAQVFMVADACHAGNLAGTAGGGTQITAENLKKQYATEVKLLACGPEELSQEGKQWGGGRGAFSFHLIDGLMGLADSNGDFDVNLFEIRRYLEDKVPAETAPNSQYPLVLFDRNASIALVDPQMLAHLKEEKAGMAPTFSTVATRGLEEEYLGKSDSLGQELYRAFQLALSERRLLEPEGGSAYDYYQQLAKRPDFAPMEASTRRNLAVALQDDAQVAVNSYLDTDPREMARRWKEGKQAYDHIPVYLEKSIELMGNDFYMTPSLRSKQYYFEGMLLRMDGEKTRSEDLLREALQKVEAAMALEPQGAHLYNEKGLIEGALENSEQEMEAYKKAHELAPAWAMPLFNLATLSMFDGDLGQAKNWIDNAIALKPSFAAAYNLLGAIYQKTEKPSDAEKAFLKSIELDSTLSWAYTNLAGLYIVQKDYLKAERYASKAVEIADDDPNAFYTLGNINMKTGHYPRAIELYEQVIQLQPDHPYAHFSLGLALENTGDIPRAIAAEKKNLEVNPDYPNPAFSVAALYASQNDPENALIWLKIALEKGYSNKDQILKAEEFASLRETEAFIQLMDSYFPK
ncbi:MAG: tetratricopeptide repeat protein [Lewinellaceae bacterium]|nr:tetratricopeptide repeat protein [Lewinellaceae bacterium]